MSSIRSNLPGSPEPSDASSAPLAAQLRPFRAMLGRSSYGVVLDLEPFGADAVASAWCRTAPNEYALTLALEPDQLAPSADDRGRIVGRVLHDAGVRRRLASAPLADLLLVRIDGPIEVRDAEAIRASHRGGGSVLAAEMRAVVAVHGVAPDGIRLEARSREIALTFVAEGLRQHVARIRRASPRSVALPDLGLVRQLMDRTGQLSIRPIETEVFASSIDVGISTSGEEGRAADTSAIYDLLSGTWHGD